MILEDFLYECLLSIRDVECYALIGRAGTGKSHNASRIAQRLQVDTILDDGLLVRDSQILAGKSAKNESTAIGSVKRAIFVEQADVAGIRKALIKHNVRKLLILATSGKMLRRICQRIGLRHPREQSILTIENHLGRNEIKKAGKKRRYEGFHCIPVQRIEVQRRYPDIIFDSLLEKLSLPKWFAGGGDLVDSGTLVTPVYDTRNRVMLLERALKHLVRRVVREYDVALDPRKVIVRRGRGGDIRIKMRIPVQYGMDMKEASGILQARIRQRLRDGVGIDISALDIVLTEDLGERELEPQS